jgi:hypothetical protein
MMRSTLLPCIAVVLGACTTDTTRDPAVQDIPGGRLEMAEEHITPLQNGDLIFQQLNSEQASVLALATGSPWTHVGIIHQQDGEWLVLEAIGPVGNKPLNEWIDQGVGEHFVVKRLAPKAGTLDEQALEGMQQVGERLMGLPYDHQFLWSDEAIYCSELVWKMYAEGAGIELCAPRPLKDYDLDHHTVQQTMLERYGEHPPLEEPMVAPSVLFDCPLLFTVYADQ